VAVMARRMPQLKDQANKAVDFVGERDRRIFSASMLSDAAILRNLSFSSLSSMMESAMLSAESGTFSTLLKSGCWNCGGKSEGRCVNLSLIANVPALTLVF
jgi:hypothetical protein